MSYSKVAQIKDVAELSARLTDYPGPAIPVDATILSAAAGSPLAAPIAVGPFSVGNRWCIHPMEGWDANRDGSPSPHALRRWRRFGESGAKLIWGGEAAAVWPEGRANPNQTLATASNEAGLALLRQSLLDAHRQHFDTTDDLLIGLQLTHSGRFCRPNSKQLEPKIPCPHPLLDAKFGIDSTAPGVIWTDAEIERLMDSYVSAAKLALRVGYQFVDVKACHGYLLHEFLGARQRPGKFGGDLTGRSRILTTIIDRIRQEIPGLAVGVRLSVFDLLPFQSGSEVGRPMRWPTDQPYEHGFGINPLDPSQPDLAEPIELCRRLQQLGVIAINVSGGSPYYNPHCQRPAIFPPSDGYQPPEDPLVGVARQIHVTRQMKEALPNVVIVGSALTYLQDFLPHVAQGLVRAGWADLVGLGRMVLSYPDLPADVLRHGRLQRKKVCRTFSECTTGPRNGILSGCFPLDDYYKSLPEAEVMQQIKQQRRRHDG